MKGVLSSTAGRLRARHLALWGVRGGGEEWRACALVPASPRSRPVPLLDGRGTQGFPGDQVPSKGSDGGGLGLGGRPSLQVFKEPRRRPGWRAPLSTHEALVRLEETLRQTS